MTFMHTYCWFVQANSYKPKREYVIISLKKLPNSNGEVTPCGDIPQQVDGDCLVQEIPSLPITSLG